MIHIDKAYQSTNNLGSIIVYTVIDKRSAGSVNFRSCKLWRLDNRYSGYVTVRRHASDGVELSFDALRHGAKPRPPVIIHKDHVDKFILSLLEVRKETE